MLTNIPSSQKCGGLYQLSIYKKAQSTLHAPTADLGSSVNVSAPLATNTQTPSFNSLVLPTTTISETNSYMGPAFNSTPSKDDSVTFSISQPTITTISSEFVATNGSVPATKVSTFSSSIVTAGTVTSAPKTANSTASLFINFNGIVPKFTNSSSQKSAPYSTLGLKPIAVDGTIYGLPTGNSFPNSTSTKPAPPEETVSGPPLSWSYKGCYVDGMHGRILSRQQPDLPKLTVKPCIPICAGLGYSVAGMEYVSTRHQEHVEKYLTRLTGCPMLL